jgi:hypothetical protein
MHTLATDSALQKYIHTLISGPMFRFSDGLHPTLPLAANGVYTIWKQNEFLYVGIAGRKLNLSIEHIRMGGLKDWLDSHWRGGRSGDQFAVYVFDRFIVPTLTDEQRRQFGTGQLQGDVLTRNFIQKYLSYRFAVTQSYKEAMTIETYLAKGRSSAGFPLLNVKRKNSQVSGIYSQP